MFTSIFERTDSLLQWREIGEEGPGPLKVWRPFLAVVALMVGCVGRGRFRDKGLIAAGTSWLSERVDILPAGCTEEGYRIDAEWMATGKAFYRQHKPESLTAPSEEPILYVFT